MHSQQPEDTEQNRRSITNSRSFRTATPLTQSTEFYLESASSPDTLVRHRPSPSMNITDLAHKPIQSKMTKKLIEIYCQAKYSEDDFDKLKKAKVDGLRHLDLSFNHNLKNLNFSKNSSLAWKRLSDVYSTNGTPYCIFKEREVDQNGVPIESFYDFYNFENLEVYKNAIGLLINGSGLSYIQRLFVKDEEDWASAAYRLKMNMGDMADDN